MKPMLFVVCLFCAMPLLIATDDIKKEMAQLEGEWEMVSGSANGVAMPDEQVKAARRIAKNGETTMRVGGLLFMKAKFTIDPTKSPKAIDYDMIDGFTKGKKQLGIYKLDGDTATFCFGAPGKARPDDFTSKPSSERTLSVWKRVK